jgi:hypothetical protein
VSDDLGALMTAARRRETVLDAVLRAVTSGDDLQTVLLDIAAAASGLLDAKTAGVFVLEGGEIGMYAEFKMPDGESVRGRWPRPNDRTSSLAEVLRERSVIRFDDQSSIGVVGRTALLRAHISGSSSAPTCRTRPGPCRSTRIQPIAQRH